MSKAGQTTAKLAVSYNYNGTVQTKYFNVTIYVTARDEDIDKRQSDATGKQVTNTVQFIDHQTVKIIRVDRYTGDAGTVDYPRSTSQWSNMIDSEYLTKSLKYAGYVLRPYLDNQDQDDPDLDKPDQNDQNLDYALTHFTDTDQYFSVYLYPVKDERDNGHNSDDQQEVKPFLRGNNISVTPLNFSAYLKSGNVKDLPDPANFIANMNELPADTKVSWIVAPKYEKDEDGNYEPYPTNIPEIQVAYNGHTFVFGGEENGVPEDLKTGPILQGLMTLSDDDGPCVKSNVQLPLNGSLPAAADMIANPEPDEEYYWVLKPDLSHAGYSYGSVSDSHDCYYVMVKVLAPQPKTDDKDDKVNPGKQEKQDHEQQRTVPVTTDASLITNQQAGDAVAAKKQALPQTGNHESSLTSLLALFGLSLAGVVQLFGKKRN